MLHKACSQSDSDHYQANQLVFCLAWLASSSSTVQPRQVNKKISSHRKLWSCYSPIMTHQSLQYILLVYKEAENSKLYTRGGNCLFKPCDENSLSYGLVIIWGWGLLYQGLWLNSGCSAGLQGNLAYILPLWPFNLQISQFCTGGIGIDQCWTGWPQID